jgi:hypothetical protein
MPQGSDWLPSSRDGQLHLAHTWVQVLTVKGALWAIPAERVTNLETLTTSAEAKLEAAKSSARNPVTTAECGAAFAALLDEMRDIKRRWLLSPPLASEDFIALSLRPRGASSPIPPPVDQATADITFPGIHLVELVKLRIAGEMTGDRRSYYGIRIFWGFQGQSSARFPYRLAGEPASGMELPYSFFTRRRRHLFDWDGESGSPLWICLRYENSKGEPGPFGPFLRAVVP